jgi:ParB family chromosome partitioning protein
MEIKMADEMIYDVPTKDINDIQKSGLNVRHRDVDVEIEGLAKSIEKHGLLQPIVLRGKYGSPPYDLIVGQRRLLAHKLLAKRSIRSRFKPSTYGDFKAKVESLIENMQRVKLNHADAAEAMTTMYNHYNKSVRKVAEELGISEVTVRDYLRIDQFASPKAKRLLRLGKVKKEDIKRVIRAAQGNMRKADELLDYLPNMSTYDKDRMAEYGEEHPHAVTKEIVTEARKPRLETTVILQLAPEIDEALEAAAGQLDMDKASVAAAALCDWLKEKGFLTIR